jgi:hypothetical protein
MLSGHFPYLLTVKDGTTVWILTIFFSPYKATNNLINCRCFVFKELAQEAMRREARRLYKNSGCIQESRNKYYNEYKTEIHFGEDEDGPDYRREFGFCEIRYAKLEDEESGDDVPSSTDDESEDKY